MQAPRSVSTRQHATGREPPLLLLLLPAAHRPNDRPGTWTSVQHDVNCPAVRVDALRLRDALQRAAWRLGMVQPELVVHTVLPDGSHSFTLVLPAENVVYTPPAQRPGLNKETPPTLQGQRRSYAGCCWVGRVCSGRIPLAADLRRVAGALPVVCTQPVPSGRLPGLESGAANEGLPSLSNYGLRSSCFLRMSYQTQPLR